MERRQRQRVRERLAGRVDAVLRNDVARERLAVAGRVGGQRIVNRDHLTVRIAEVTEVAAPHRRRRYSQIITLRLAVLVAFAGQPEEGLVPDQRTANAAAGAAPILFVGLQPANLVEEAAADQRIRTRQVERRATEGVAARLGGGVEDAAAGAAH